MAGSQGSCFSAFVWSVRTSKLLEELAGHEAPVVTVAFHPHPDKQGLLATGSWDKKVKVLFASGWRHSLFLHLHIDPPLSYLLICRFTYFLFVY